MSSELIYSVKQILSAPSDQDYLDQLVTNIKDACAMYKEIELMEELDRFAQDKEMEIENMCNSNTQDFVQSVNQLLTARSGTVELTTEILNLNTTIHKSTDRMVEAKKALVDSKGVRQNIDETTQALNSCLEVLQLANRVHELIQAKKHYAALRTLDELQNVHLRDIMQYGIADMIQKAVPAMQRMVKDAVSVDLNTWLFHVKEISESLGQIAFDQTFLRRKRQQERPSYARGFKLNSAIELVLDEREEFDILDNKEIKVDFTPLHECLHIHEALGQREEFRFEFADTRRKQKDLLLPPVLTITEEEDTGLNQFEQLLGGIAGFAIIERATVKRTQNFRSQTDVNELWDSMVIRALQLIESAIVNLHNAETVLKIKRVLSVFIQTMDGLEYSVTALNAFLPGLFQKYARLLLAEYSKNVNEIISEDDYMPMVIRDMEEYTKVIEVSFYEPDASKPPSSLTFPLTLPFSQMFPYCCIDIRNFVNRFYHYSDNVFDTYNPAIDDTLRQSLDTLLCDHICKDLVKKLEVRYLGQIVQILINLEQFEFACRKLEEKLAEARQDPAGPEEVKLRATEEFAVKRKDAEKRIFELVNLKIDDLVETAEYNWSTNVRQKEPSDYLKGMTRFLSDIISSMLVALPDDIKGLIYFDALSHLASAILALPMSDSVKQITPAAVENLKLDVDYLEKFVQGLRIGLPGIFDELQQTVELLRQGKEKSEMFYNIETRMRNYAAVDPLNGPVLLEKLVDSSKTNSGSTLGGSFAKFRGSS